MKTKKPKGMGRIFQRGQVWWIQFNHNGTQHRESSKSKERGDAVRLLTQRLDTIQSGKPLAAQGGKLALDRLIEGLLNDYRMKGLRSTRRAGYAAQHLIDYFGQGKLAADITTPAITSYIVTRQSEGAASATINREAAALKRAFALAREAGLLASAPVIKLLPEYNARQGFIDHAQFTALHEALPEHLRGPIAFLYLSAWRREEVFGLQWRDVEANAIRLRPEASKSKKGRVLPLRGELAAIIERARLNRRLDCMHVFHHGGRAIRDFRGSWAKALAQAGLDPALLVHDLRRSAIRNMVRSGTPEGIVMGLSGHQTRSVFDRYNIVSESDLQAALERQEAYLKGQPATPPKIIPIKSHA